VVKRSRKGAFALFRVPVAGGDEIPLPVPADYDLTSQPLSPNAVDARGRILVTVLSAHDFYYRTAVLDPAGPSFTVIPLAFEGDISVAGWAPDGRIVARGTRYRSALWRYRPAR